MNERKGLLQAILADPEEDAPRLVYADWLEENGDEADLEHATFIRTQIERMRLAPDDDRQAELRHREESLHSGCAAFEAWRKKHTRHFSGLDRSGEPAKNGAGRYERGFPVNVIAPKRRWPYWTLEPKDLDEMARAFDRYPIREFSAFHFMGKSGVETSPLERLAAWPYLVRIRGVYVGYDGPPAHVDDHGPGTQALATSPHAQNLECLHLGSMLFGDLDWKDLFAARCMPRLNSLSVPYGQGVWPRPVRRLATAPLGERLIRFNCIGCQIEGDDLLPLLDASPLADLSVSVTDLTGWERTAVARTLRKFELRRDGPRGLMDDGEYPEPDSVEAVTGLEDFLGQSVLALVELSLSGVDLRDDILSRLAGAPFARNAVKLRLNRCHLTSASLPALRRLIACGRLRRLDLSRNFLTRADAAAIGHWPELARLHELDLSNQAAEGVGADALLDSPHLHPFVKLTV
jgi:uncharacterized protein (TIGR02996 family)